jgi:adenylate cyclase
MAEEPSLATITTRRLDRLGYVANASGGLLVFVFALFVAPTTFEWEDAEWLAIAAPAGFLVYMPTTLLLGRRWASRAFSADVVPWLESGGEANERVREAVLRHPLVFAKVAASFWALAAVLFGLLTLPVGADVAVTAGVVVALGGVTASALQYLLAERTLRPVTTRALAGGRPPRMHLPGLSTRLTMAWALVTGVPLFGIVVVTLAEIKGDLDDGQVLGTILFLAVVGGVAGLAAIRLAARAVADPLAGVERALERVERGDFEARSPVDDGSEVGMLQAGFNRMATGLAERERLREAFGTFVDPSLAERILEQGIDLAGEEVEVSVVFVDVRGYTALSERAGPREVVAQLNELYELIVPVIARHGGHANKFIGDGMLALFGAPERLPDHADRAVTAGLEIVRCVDERFGDDLRVGVGVNSGRVLVGTIGGGGRLDFTAIGDPVNTAARVEAATRQTGDDLLITEATRDLLRESGSGWRERPGVALKGKSQPVAVYAPA